MFIPKKLKLVNFMSHLETEFSFKKGVVSVIGLNMDDGGQSGNGSGKSSLNEAICYLLTGSVIRDCKPKELVMEGKDFSEISISLENSIYGFTTIWRKIWSNGKSSEVAVWVNGKKITSCPDVNSYNKFILGLLRISKEDFFNFFLLTKEQFQPFLQMSDSAKKMVVNRFSGAGKIEGVEELVKKEVKIIIAEIAEIEKKITAKKIESEVYSKELIKNKEEIENSKNFVLKVQELEVELKSFEEKFLQINFIKKILLEDLALERDSLKEKLKDEVEINSSEKKAFEEELEKIKVLIKDEELSLKTFIKVSEAGLSEFMKEEEILVKKLISESKVLEVKIQKLKKEIKENEVLASGTIECPSCQHLFMPLSPEFSFDQILEIIDGKTEEFEKLRGEKTKLETEVKDKEKEILSKKSVERIKVEKEIAVRKKAFAEVQEKGLRLNKDFSNFLRKDWNKTELESKIRNFNWWLNSVKMPDIELDCCDCEKILSKIKEKAEKNLISQLKTILDIETETEKNFSTRKLELERLELKLEGISSLELKVKGFLEKIETLKLEKAELELQLKDKEKEKAGKAVWLVHFKNFKTHLANKSISSMNSYINHFLKEIGSNVMIRLESEKEVAGRIKDEINVAVLRDGFNCGNYGKFSAGEKGRMNICSILANQELINLEASGEGGGLDLLVCDEVFDSVDIKGLERMMSSLDELDKTIIFVSQNETNFMKNVIIRKENKISSISI